MAEDGTDAEALTALVRGRVEAGDPAAARASLDAVLAKDPGNPAARLLEAGLAAVEGDAAAAEAGYRALIADQPGLAAAHQAWFAFLAAEGRSAEAAAALDAGLAAAPGDAQLLFAKAGLREAEGDREAAIALYEQLYAEDPGAPVIANNLASLLATARSDPASLERAFGIARRLRGSEVPPFQDTYGWILHLRGDSAQGLDYLVPAAEAMPGNAQVQFHRAEAEFALQRWDAAAASFDRALAAAAAGSPAARGRDRPQPARGHRGDAGASRRSPGRSQAPTAADTGDAGAGSAEDEAAQPVEELRARSGAMRPGVPAAPGRGDPRRQVGLVLGHQDAGAADETGDRVDAGGRCGAHRDRPGAACSTIGLPYSPAVTTEPIPAWATTSSARAIAAA